MNKRILIISGIVVALVGILLTVWFISRPQEEPQPQAPTTPQTPPPTDEHGGSDAEGEPLSQDVQAQMLQKSTTAAEVFVTQQPGETAQQRKDRLSSYFAPGSPAPEAKPPVEDTYYMTNSVSAIESDWIVTERPGTLGVIVYLTVNSHNGYQESEVVQSWIVENIEHEGIWLPHRVVRSNLPYVEGE